VVACRSAVLIRVRKPWELPESAVTDERRYLSRRNLLAGLGLSGLTTLGQGCYLSVEPDPDAVVQPPSGFLADLYPAPKNHDYPALPNLTSEYMATHVNNFYEFTQNKAAVWRLTGNFVTEPWTIEVGGLVRNPATFDLEQLVRRLGIEERVYRFRCVEAWSMIVPWSGFSLSRLLDLVQPLSSAKYVRFVTAQVPDQMPGLTALPRLPWPYHEGLRLDEAMHELTLLVTGLYGKPLYGQNGAPLRLVVPWKYGFKNIKSIVKIELVEEQPKTFWNTINPSWYDFYANVTPDDSVRRVSWSQATEQPIDGGPRVPTQEYNGYGEAVAALYA
jgi:methionine sulfoxide reductase catalytic subunit